MNSAEQLRLLLSGVDKGSVQSVNELLRMVDGDMHLLGQHGAHLTPAGYLDLDPSGSEYAQNLRSLGRAMRSMLKEKFGLDSEPDTPGQVWKVYGLDTFEGTDYPVSLHCTSLEEARSVAEEHRKSIFRQQGNSSMRDRVFIEDPAGIRRPYDGG